MNLFFALFGIYAAFRGFNAAGGEEYFAGADIGGRQDFASATSRDGLQEMLTEPSMKGKRSSFERNSTENSNNEMDERWKQQTDRILENSNQRLFRKKKKQRQMKHSGENFPHNEQQHQHQHQHHQRKRTKVRRKKSKINLLEKNNLTSPVPVTNLIASATVIDNSFDDDGTISKLELKKYRNSILNSKDLPNNNNNSEMENFDSSIIQTTARIIMSNSLNIDNFTSRHHFIENNSNLNSDAVQVKRKSKKSHRNDKENGENLRERGKKRNKLRLKEQERKLRLAAKDEKRKLLQAKREMRKRRKFERLEKRKRLKDTRNASSLENLDETTKYLPENIRNKTLNNYQNHNFMTAPSIDYFINSSNYVDNNESVPMASIDVSVENPSGIEVENGHRLAAIKAYNPSKISTTTIKTIQNLLKGNESNDQVKLNVVDNILSHSINVVTATNPEVSSPINARHFKNTKLSHQNDATTKMNEGGDLSCLKDDFQPAPEVEHADIKYLRNDLRGTENAFLEIEYICHHGFKLEFNNKTKQNIFCRNGQWVGIRPSCVRVKDLTKLNETCNYPKRCEQLCYARNGLQKCACHKGFRMKNNHCEDINECVENTSVCEFGCINTVGSYRCKCPKGLRVGDANSCIDVNECLLRNGHGPCQDTCINTWGSYKCSCNSLPGSQLSSDNHSCSDIDECSVNNGGCSHTCLNTMGRAFCLCPEGWILDRDWKTCVDIDECAEQITDSSDQRCEFGCINTPGSFSCLVDFGADQPIDDDDFEIQPECPDGFSKNTSTNDCEDINECSENNGGCFHRCINTIGSFHCLCRIGFIFDSDKYTCIASNSSTDISCPPLFPPKHGYLECSRPIASDIIGTDTNGFGGRRRITNRPGSQCILRCPTGFRINGQFSKQCSTSGIWVGDGDGTCIRYPQPKLICPMDIILETPPNETMAKLRIPRPKTDVNYDRDVSISPEWLRDSEVALECGIKNITYTALHPVSKLSVSCTFTLTVLEGQPPSIKYCPPIQKYSLNKQHDSIKIGWNEPIFTDNVNVTEISRTNRPGNSFGVGSHQIIYVAKDLAGYTTRCVFKLLVNVPFRETLNHPLPIYHMFY